MSIKVSDNAFKRVAFLLKQAGHSGQWALRVAVDGGGCSGFIYNYELVSMDTVSPEDKVITKDNIRIVIDPVSEEFMKECIIDFVEELGTSYFEVKNPNAKSKCGCGNSFSV